MTARRTLWFGGRLERGARVRSRRRRTQIRSWVEHRRHFCDTSGLEIVDPYAEWRDLGGEA